MISSVQENTEAQQQADHHDLHDRLGVHEHLVPMRQLAGVLDLRRSRRRRRRRRRSAAGSRGAAAAEAAAAAAAGGGGAAVCANAGALAISATAPTRAMKGVFSLLSSICRQFLVGLARLAVGSSRESVSTLVELSNPEPVREPRIRSRYVRPRRLLPCSGFEDSPRASVDLPVGAKSHRQKNLRLGTFDNPVPQRQGASRAIMHSCAY